MTRCEKRPELGTASPVSLDTIVIASSTLALLAGAMLALFALIGPRLIESRMYLVAAFLAVIIPLSLVNASTAFGVMGNHSVASILLAVGASLFPPALGTMLWITLWVSRKESEAKPLSGDEE